jgi:3D-(3,5/4)-trihydroxycyclohexane-1,2-dione acylhydrolase (decyclizing)
MVRGEAGGGHWWDVTVPEVGRTEMRAVARLRYKKQQARQSLVN